MNKNIQVLNTTLFITKNKKYVVIECNGSTASLQAAHFFASIIPNDHIPLVTPLYVRIVHGVKRSSVNSSVKRLKSK